MASARTSLAPKQSGMTEHRKRNHGGEVNCRPRIGATPQIDLLRLSRALRQELIAAECLRDIFS